MKNIELNTQFIHALTLIEKGANIFITGKAGTGKSTLLAYFRNNCRKNLAVLAPTGVAAVNVAGQTIHSFFKFKPDITVDKVKKEYKNRGRRGFYKKLDLIVIDEISMVRADLLDCVDTLLRMHGKDSHRAFGGIQMIFIGDLYQLPPIVMGKEREMFESVYESPYFFSSHVAQNMQFEIVELEKIYRQKDKQFITILNSIRNRSITDKLLESLNSRHNPDFASDDELYMYLTTTNDNAARINNSYLSKLTGKNYVYEGKIGGEFDQKSAPADIVLNVKVNSQIMLVNNDRENRWINGTVGKIVKIKKEYGEDIIFVALDGGAIVEVNTHTWEMFRFIYNEKTKSLESETIGTFTQYPLILAWAITIHKSQGKTFKKVIVDMDRGAFAHGQTYVALSRCVSLEGLVLKKPIKKSHILLDWKVVKFLTQFQYKKSDKAFSFENKIAFITQAIQDKRKIEIVYLKANDVKSKRVVKPQQIGEVEYLGKQFLGFTGYDYLRDEERVFRVDRILEMK